MSFFAELRRRNVFRVGIAYLVTAWLVAQIADVVLGVIGSPDWVMRTLVLLLALGFPFALIFAWAFELTPEGLKREKEVDRTQSITHQTGRKLDFAIIGVLVIALAYFAIDKFAFQPGSASSSSSSAVEAGADLADRASDGGKSIAVLPFVNMSEDTSNEYFSDGISEEILNALARVRDLKVAGRTSSFAFKGQNQDLRQIGEALGVDHILEGSVRKAGNKIRITAQLIQVDDGFHLWSDSYDRELDDVFAIQDEIANAILEELKARLIGGEPVEIVAQRANTEAYDLYLLARQRMYERTGPTIRSAAELLDRAIALDPDYAPVYAQRGIAALLLAEGAGTYGDVPRDQSATQAKLYLDKALELDPDLAEAWAGMGLYHQRDPTEIPQSIEALEKALVLNPSLIDASNWLHNALQAMGQPAQAHKVVMDMVERDPLYRPGVRNAVNSYIWFGEADKALAHVEKVRPLIPNDATIASSLAGIQYARGEFAAAVEEAEEAIALQPSNSVARLTLGFALLSTHQFERVAAEGEEWLPVFALQELGRSEEASILAFRRADELADIVTLFTFLNVAGRSDELVAYLEQRWPDLDALRADFPPYGGLGDFLMMDVALAYRRTGNPARFDQALAMVSEAHDRLEAEGVANNEFYFSQAARWTLAGDLERGLSALEQAIDAGGVTAARITRAWPHLEPLEGDPRFEAIQARMLEHVNREREKLGLEPVSA